MNHRARRIQLIAGGLLAGAGGAFAAIRRVQALSAEPPVNPIAGTQRRHSFRGHDVFITEIGSGSPVFLFHGIYAGASSFEFRKLAPLLAKTHRVIVMDFLGCGLSDRPDIQYTTDLFVEQIIDVVTTFADGPAMIVGSSLGGAFALRAASKIEDRVSTVVALNPTGLEDNRNELPLRRLTESVMRTPVIGEGFFAGLTTAGSIRTFLRRVYSSNEFVTPDVVAHYEAVSRVPGARYVTAAFIGGSLACDLASDLPFIDVPVFIAWGERARIGPPNARVREYAALGRNVEVVTYPQSGALVHEEIPEILAADIGAFAGRAAFAEAADFEGTAVT